MRRTADCAGVSDATQCMRPVPSLQLVDSLHFVALVSHATETVTQHLSPRLFVGDEGEAQMGRLACPLAPLYMRVHTAWGACADGLSPSIDLCAPAWPEGDFSMLRELSACAEQPAALPPMPCAPPNRIVTHACIVDMCGAPRNQLGGDKQKVATSLHRTPLTKSS